MICGVVEDVVEIIFNFKQVCFKQLLSEEEIIIEKVYLIISGKEEFWAGDIEEYINVFKIMNFDFLICQMELFVNFEVELMVIKGCGYVFVDENLFKDVLIGVILVDVIYMLIKNVVYCVENICVGQWIDYEKFFIDVKMDGIIYFEDVIKEVFCILIQYLMLIMDENIIFDDVFICEENIVDEYILYMCKLLKILFEDLDLFVWAYNCLKVVKINILVELVKYDMYELFKFWNFGKKLLVEIEELLQDKGLIFGMDFFKYKFDEE